MHSHEEQSQPSQYGRASISVPAHLDYSSAIRDFTLAALKTVGGFEKEWAYRMQLAVDEVFMNAVRYGSGPNADVRLSFDFAPHRVVISVDDTGTGTAAISARELAEHIEASRRKHLEREAQHEKNLALSGRGLSQLVSTWTDDLRFEDSPSGGIRVTMTKAI